jgi:EAL domain-containing protein (putative c-di-GMP-specific phosphodiesterase class I)
MMGETLRLQTVAEGIEREPQRASLIGLGCTLGQGFCFERPLEAEDVPLRVFGAGGSVHLAASK